MTHAPRKKAAHHDEEHENHERWLLTYADMITLLMVLFIVLFALGQVDKDKFQKFAQGMSAGFGAPLAAVSGGRGPMAEEGITPRPLSLLTAAMTPPTAGTAANPEVERALEQIEAAKQANARAEARKEAERLRKLKRRIEADLAAKGMAKSARLSIDERGLVITIVTDEVVFPADRAELQPAGQRVLDAVAPSLRDLPNAVVVEGHTNTVAVKPRYYPSDWQLSAARATTVVQYLDEHHRIPRRRMEAKGYADQRPLAPSGSARANRVTRRVEVVLMSTLPPESRGLLAVSAAATADAPAAASHSTSGH